MSYGKRFGRSVLSLEDAEVGVVEPTPTEEVVGVEPESDGVEEAVDQVEEVAGDIEGATQDTENLEAVADELEGTLEEGGALPQTVAVAEIAVESYIRNLTGRKPTKRLLLATESFGGAASREKSTRIAIENIREVAGKAWAAIVGMFKRGIEMLRGLISKITGGFAALKNKIKGLRKSTADSKDKIDENKKDISIPKRIWNAMKMGGKFTKDAFFKGLENTKKFLMKILGWFKIGKKTIDEAKPMLLLENSKDKEDGALEFPINPKPLVDATAALGKVTATNDDGTVEVGELIALPGDPSVTVTGPGVEVIDGKLYQAAATMSVNISNVGEESDDAEDVTIKSFTSNEINQALDQAEELVDMAEQAKAETESAMKVQSELLKDAEKAGKVDEEKKTPFLRRAGSAVRGFFSRASSALMRPITAVIYFVRRVVGYAIELISLALVSVGGVMVVAGIGGSAVANKVGGVR